ncbi:MAG: AMP-binding protein, partial [Verrucomicrobiae bacterium]|nr:AMP-binding protein [Verrucomicrobiae bacterium]
MNTQDIDVLLNENRSFPPPKEFQENAHISGLDAYRELYKKSIDDPDTFWAEAAKELHWFKPWDKVLDDSDKPFFKWFTGATINLSYNCLDRHLEGPNRNKAALIWEGEPGDSRVLTYNDLHREVCKFANGLKSLGVTKGDRVAIYLPMIPELAISLLACARIGAVHSVIFAGFSADSIKDRVLDMEAKWVITGDGSWRRGKPLHLKTIVDEAIEGLDSVEKVVVVKREDSAGTFDCAMKEGRDVDYHALVKDQSKVCP